MSDQIRSVAQLCPTLLDPMNRSTPGLPVHHPLPEFTQTHVHRVSDAIQPSHPLLSPSPLASNPSQHQSTNESTLRMRWPKYWSFSFVGSAICGLLDFLLGEGNGNSLQCSCLENPRDGGAWWAAIYGVAQSRIRLM